MADKQAAFKKEISESYGAISDNSIYLGTALFEGSVIPDAQIKMPLKMFNRHGLVAGATGTGKTRTLQLLAERLSQSGVPSLLMDMKGDLGGIAKPGTAHDWLLERAKKMGDAWEPKGFPVDWLGLSENSGAPLRTTVSELGPDLLSRLLDLTDTQASVLTVIFRFCDESGLLLVDFKDMAKVLDFISGEGEAEFKEKYGEVAGATLGVIRRKLIALESEAAANFFSEPSFEVQDLMRLKDKMGIIHLLHLAPVLTKPSIFTSFLLALLAEVFAEMPEVGDLDKPKLVIFIDEAHLVFKDASKTLLEQIEMTARLIRSRGVGLIFCSQRPDDVPEAILSQLGFKVQHALRAFTAKDRTAMKKIAQNFPITEFYETETLLSQMGTGEALVTVLNEKGIPTPLAHILVAAPHSSMEALPSAEFQKLAQESDLYKKYSQAVDPESAFEILSAKVEKRLANEGIEEEPTESPVEPATGSKRLPNLRVHGRAGSEESKSAVRSKQEPVAKKTSLTDSKLMRDVGKTVAREVSRGLLGAIGLKTARRGRGSSLAKDLLKSLF